VNPRIRNPLLTWLLTVITGGIYFPIWVWNITNELNNAEGQTVFKVRIWRYVFTVLNVLAIFGLAVFAITDNPIFFAAMLLCLLCLGIYVQLEIGNYIVRKDLELNTGRSYSNLISIFLFWFVADLGVAYMQSGINRIIYQERTKSE
jgi:hypothetical protein